MRETFLDKDFKPIIDSFESFQRRAKEPITLTIKRGEEVIFPFSMRISSNFEKSYFYTKRLLLTLLWMVGGEEIFYTGSPLFYHYLEKRLETDEEILSSLHEMEKIFNRSFSFKRVEEVPQRKDKVNPFSGSFKGCRIGLDLGGSDRKVTVVKDNEVVYSEETLWSPKEQNDPQYHYLGMLDSLERAKKYLPHVDGIGISTAGIVANNELLFAALYAKVTEEKKQKEARPVFKNIMKEHFPNVPFQVENDGDVSAIGASALYHKNKVLGLALGTSFAAGYVKDSSLNGWISELSKVPINVSKKARKHYILGIEGSASEYLSQKGIVYLLENNGLSLQGDLPHKLLQIQKLAEEGDPLVLKGYHDMGIYLGSDIRYLSLFYDIESVFLLGRVMSGKGGEILLQTASDYLKKKKMQIDLFSADEDFKRLGQSYIAASLPNIGK